MKRTVAVLVLLVACKAEPSHVPPSQGLPDCEAGQEPTTSCQPPDDVLADRCPRCLEIQQCTRMATSRGGEDPYDLCQQNFPFAAAECFEWCFEW